MTYHKHYIKTLTEHLKNMQDELEWINHIHQIKESTLKNYKL